MKDGPHRPAAVERILQSRPLAPLRRVVSTIRLAFLTDHPARFTARELRGDTDVHEYRVRASGVAFLVAHNAPDVQVVDEIFYIGLYDPPAEVAAILAARGGALRALDLGGNVGLFGVWLAGRGDFAHLESFEPDPRNAAILQRTIDANDLGAHWTLREAAAGTRDGSVRFAAGDYAMSHVVDDDATQATITVPSVDVLPLIAQSDFVKIDIEGGEWAILADARFAAAPPAVLVLEYHPEGCPGDDPHSTAARLLDDAGFARAPIFESASGVGMTWAWPQAAQA